MYIREEWQWCMCYIALFCKKITENKEEVTENKSIENEVLTNILFTRYKSVLKK